MDALLKLDADTVIWLNQGIGRVTALDEVAYLLVSDYFIPLTISFWLLGLWFSGKDAASRDRNQRAVLQAAISLACANLAVMVMNHY